MPSTGGTCEGIHLEGIGRVVRLVGWRSGRLRSILDLLGAKLQAVLHQTGFSSQLKGVSKCQVERFLEPKLIPGSK